MLPPKISRICPFPSASTVINSMSSPPIYFSYTTTALLGLPNSILASLQGIPHTAARIITSERKSDHVTHLPITCHSFPLHFVHHPNSASYKTLHHLAHDYLSTLTLNPLLLPHSIILHSNWHSFSSIKSWTFRTLISWNFKYMLFPLLGTLSSAPSPNLVKSYASLEAFHGYLFTISTPN